MKPLMSNFESSKKTLAITLIEKLSSMKMSNIAIQLKSLKIEISETFLVHFVTNSRPSLYGPFKISYNSHEDKGLINDF